MRLFFVALAVTAAVALQPAGTNSNSPQLLQSVRTAIGGSHLEAVRSLSVDFTREGAGMDFILPDKFRYRTGTIAHLLDGTSFWQTRETAGEVRKAAQGRTEFTFAVSAIKYLLAVPSVLDISVKVGPSRVVDELGQVDVLIFKGQRGFSLDLFLDPSTHVPRGSEYLFPFEGGALRPITARYEDYRVVNGVKFPFLTKSVQRGHPQTTTVAAIRVNPDLRGVFRVE